jgi:recombination protein RecR
MADAIQELAALLARLPGVGKRNALRLTFHLLKAPTEYTEQLGKMMLSIHDQVNKCSICANLTEKDPCPICTGPKRDNNLICVVASVPDLWAIEESGAFHGRYHVLHGLLAPLDGIGPDDLNVGQLRARIQKEDIEEVIVATRPSVEGEATALLIRQTLEGLTVKVSRIASGISYGGELEYADRMTLGQALAGRLEM